MPELPEVETVARLIAPRVTGRTILSAEAGWLRSLGGPSLADFEESVRGATIAHVGRRAKYIVLSLTRPGQPAQLSGALLVHLRMSGRLHVEPRSLPLGPYTRVALQLSDEHTLRFDDVREYDFVSETAAPRMKMTSAYSSAMTRRKYPEACEAPVRSRGERTSLFTPANAKTKPKSAIFALKRKP